MSGQALDLRRSAQIVWRHKALVGVVTAMGLMAGVAYTVLNPPTYLSSALVALSPSANIASQTAIVTSGPVLSLALPGVEPGMSLNTLHNRVQASRAATGLMSVSADGRTPAQAIETANAVARSYVTYVNSANNAGQATASAAISARDECYGERAGESPVLPCRGWRPAGCPRSEPSPPSRSAAMIGVCGSAMR